LGYDSGDAVVIGRFVKMRLHLFNPENDLALANAKHSFTPPKNARLLAESGALLPIWLAAPGDAVLVGCVDRYSAVADELNHCFGLGVNVVEDSSCFTSFAPWGWSAYARRIFERGGATEGLPTDVQLYNCKSLSHRRTAAKLNLKLRDRLTFKIPPPAVEIFSSDELDRIDYTCFIKSPWSSTGRGVFLSTAVAQKDLHLRVAGIIRHQGSVMVEHALVPVVDFAMLFNISDGRCVFCGYSLFRNTGNAYAGNIIATDTKLKAFLARYVPEQQLTELEEVMPGVINEIYGKHYSGNIGVDMLVYRDDSSGHNCINPTVEVNMRNTMGFVAKALGDKIMHHDVTGMFTVSYGSMPILDNPQFMDGRLVAGGYYPVGETSGFTFRLQILQT